MFAQTLLSVVSIVGVVLGQAWNSDGEGSIADLLTNVFQFSHSNSSRSVVALSQLVLAIGGFESAPMFAFAPLECGSGSLKPYTGTPENMDLFNNDTIMGPFCFG